MGYSVNFYRDFPISAPSFSNGKLTNSTSYYGFTGHSFVMDVSFGFHGSTDPQKRAEHLAWKAQRKANEPKELNRGIETSYYLAKPFYPIGGMALSASVLYKFNRWVSAGLAAGYYQYNEFFLDGSNETEFSLGTQVVGRAKIMLAKSKVAPFLMFDAGFRYGYYFDRGSFCSFLMRGASLQVLRQQLC